MTDAKEALKNEAQDAEPTFEFRGKKYVVPPNMNEADGDVLEFYEADKPIHALKALLGDAQFAAYKAKEKPKVKDHIEFLDAAFSAMGTSSGE